MADDFDEDSYRCGKLKVREESDWRAEHAPHGEPERTYPEHQPPSYRLVTLVCPCTARFTMMEEPTHG